jgi:hypothetical protein
MDYGRTMDYGTSMNYGTSMEDGASMDYGTSMEDGASNECLRRMNDDAPMDDAPIRIPGPAVETAPRNTRSSPARTAGETMFLVPMQSSPERRQWATCRGFPLCERRIHPLNRVGRRNPGEGIRAMGGMGCPPSPRGPLPRPLPVQTEARRGEKEMCPTPRRRARRRPRGCRGCAGCARRPRRSCCWACWPPPSTQRQRRRGEASPPPPPRARPAACRPA